MNKQQDNSPTPGRLVVVSGPSGVGKGTILKRVFAQSKQPLVMSVSATTRKPRPGEIDGVHYHFLSPEEFHLKRERDEFLECFEVYPGGHWYGTLESLVRKELEKGNELVLEIDLKGARAVRKKYPDAITVFIEPKSPEILEKRLRGRGTESDAIMVERLHQAANELAHAGEYDYRIVNDEIDQAVREFIEIIDRN